MILYTATKLYSQTAGSSWRSQSKCIRWASPTVAGCILQAASAHCLQITWSRNRPPGSPDRRYWSAWCQWWRWGRAPARRNSWTQTPSPCQGNIWRPDRQGQCESNLKKWKEIYCLWKILKKIKNLHLPTISENEKLKCCKLTVFSVQQMLNMYNLLQILCFLYILY